LPFAFQLRDSLRAGLRFADRVNLLHVSLQP
jgi:hypothetical protein